MSAPTTDASSAMPTVFSGAPTVAPGSAPPPPVLAQPAAGQSSTGHRRGRGSRSARRTVVLGGVLLLLAAIAGVTLVTSVGDGSDAPTTASRESTVGEWTAVSTSTNVTCGIKSRGLFCWGDNEYGSVGDGTTTDRSVPTPVHGLGDVSSVSVAYGQARACAVSDGDVYCWGQNASGGDIKPTRVDGISGASEVTAGVTTCAVRQSQAYCWGSNVDGGTGTGSTIGFIPEPTRVIGLEDVASIATGVGTTCAITHAADLYCWGRNTTGQVGDGTTQNRLTPVRIAGLRSVTSVTLGADATCAVADGTVYCWGSGPVGRPENGRVGHLSPTPVGVSGARDVALTSNGGCATVNSGRVTCWQVLDTAPPSTPAVLPELDQVTNLVGVANTCAISAGHLYCWGRNNAGQLGDGTTTTSFGTPARVSDPE
ncbi:hypothetical protein ABLE94_04770 [Gordonia sp. VNK1]|uniref:RCC1 domain-containing protein n=1 Tax=Gordonia oleivorans TaxID=3156618 RepID=UPI0032B36671